MTLSAADLLRIRQLPLFEVARLETFTMLLANACVQSFTSGVSLLAEGEMNDRLCILLDGTVELGSRWNGREATLALLRPPATFVLASVVLGIPALTGARSITRGRVLTIPGADLRRAMREDVRFAVALNEEIAGCYCGVVRTLKGYKLRGAVERLANYLLSQQQQQGGASSIRLACKKRVLASLLGMTPENLSRAFAGLARHGVTVAGPTVLLSRPDALSKLANPDPLIDNHGAPSAMQGRADRERRRAAEGLHR